MDDIVPALLEKIEKEYKAGVEASGVIAGTMEKIEKGAATYADIYPCADEIGRILYDAYTKNLTAETLPNETLYYNIVKRVFEPTLKAAYEDMARLCSAVQESLNEKAGMGLKAIKPAINLDRLRGIIESVSPSKFKDERD